MPNLKWKIGEVEVFQIVELEAGKIIQESIKDAIPENTQKINWLYPHFADKGGSLKALVQGFLIKSGNLNILIDTCNGNDKERTDIPEWSNLQIDFLKRLCDTGVSKKDVDIVACTHLHMDHVGWNTKLEDDAWVPTFPNAKYIFVKGEYEYWSKKPKKEIADDKAAFDDSVTPIIKTDLAELVEVNYNIDQSISFIPTPGHTPYHVSVLIESSGKQAIISGDVIHHPCQIVNPEWITIADTFPEKAVESRKGILKEIVDTDTLLIGSHFPSPVAGHVVGIKDGFKFIVNS